MHVEAIIIGAGYSGLTQAVELHGQGYQNVLLVDFEAELGGFLNRYENQETRITELKEEVSRFKWSIWTKSTVTHMKKDHDSFFLTLQCPDGIKTVAAQKVFIATGYLEKPRGMNIILGDRPAGEMTPSLALDLLDMGYLPGFSPFIFDNSEAAALLIEKLKDYPDIQVTVKREREAEIMRVDGDNRVHSIVIRDKQTNKEELIQCDSFVFSNGKLAITSFLKEILIELDSDGFILVDAFGNTSEQNVIAVGSCTAVNPDLMPMK